jgi:hypothetical protein
MDEAAPAAAPAAEKKPPLLRWVPTSLVVTLLGIALSAWLIPAFTRQWSDRQKAHELQAGIVADMASATAQVVIGGDALWSLPSCGGAAPVSGGPKPTSLPAEAPFSLDTCLRDWRRSVQRAATTVYDPWSLASVQLEARLRAYCGPKVVTAWQLFSWFVDTFVAAGRVQAREDLLAAYRGGFNLERDAARGAALVVQSGQEPTGFGPSFDDVRGWPPYKALRVKLGIGRPSPVPRLFAADARPMESALLKFEQEIAREVLKSHMTGYSTTTNDLLHDLIP